MKAIIAGLTAATIITICSHGGESQEVEMISLDEPERIDALVREPDSHANLDRGFGHRLPRGVESGSLLFVIDHRGLTGIADDPLSSLFGFDRGVKVSLALRYGITDFLDVGLVRSSGKADAFDTYELDLQYRVLDEERFFVDAAVSAGGTLFHQVNTASASGFFGRVAMGRSFFRRLYSSAGIVYHGNSTFSGKRVDEEDFSLGIPLVLNFRIVDLFHLVGESVVPVAGYSAGIPSWTAGMKLITHKHTFAILATTTKYVTTDGYTTGSNSDIYETPAFGFSVTRIFGFGL